MRAITVGQAVVAVLKLPTPVAMECPACGRFAVVELNSNQLAQQTDGTTHVCHPGLGGCNHGYTLED